MDIMKIEVFETDIFDSIEKLSICIPEDILAKEYHNLITNYRIDGSALTVETDFGRRVTVAIAMSRKGMFYHVMNELLRNIAMKLEVSVRKEEQKKWRYVRAEVVDDKWTYRENKNYIYNAIYDSRKLSFEYHIKFIAELFSVSQGRIIISHYTKLLNKWFKDKHWIFDEMSMMFVENSTSKEFDQRGIERPQEQDIVL